MASRAFAYNTGSSINGTEQLGSLAIQTTFQDYSSNPGSVKWWEGPEEDLGYIIAYPVPLDNHPTPLPNDNVILSGTYKGVDISLSNNNQTALQQFGYQQTVLGQTVITGSEKIMFSVKYTSPEPGTNASGRFIGVGTTSMNYQGNPYGGYPGNDTQSIGFNAVGQYYYNGGVVSSGLPTWTDGDIIDIALFHGQYWWIRVNGGDWNNNPAADPTTLANGLGLSGLTNFYPALCPHWIGTMQMLNIPTYGCPFAYNFLGTTTASIGFKRSAIKSEISFVALVNQTFSQAFSSGSAAKTWLNANGYWTSWGTGGDGITLYAQLNANQACGFNGGYAIPTYLYTGTNSFCGCTALNGVNVGGIPDGTYWVADGNGNKRQFTKLASSGNTLLVAAGICSLC